MAELLDPSEIMFTPFEPKTKRLRFSIWTPEAPLVDGSGSNI